ncbi:hypothetical protein [Variovorax sp. Root434]|uniref:hypothetical protein n=1 Tax=Variovorax sp. Root434 TaxID=1736536 RepID=UPI0006F9CF9E|nr:hypothetical protein [Variovorax sp. Root434]KQX34657.1 hypothetical protein ASD05_25730 [Variovorax sp. Root434]
MSRSGYSDDYDEDGTGGLWRGAVRRAIQGKRGQAALHELAKALDAMPAKTLAAESLMTEEGEFCTLGVLGQARGLGMEPIDPEDWDAVAKAFNLAPAMVREIVYENDEHIESHKWVDVEFCGPVRPYYPEYGRHRRDVRVETSADEIARQRWAHMREWVAKHTIIPKGRP